MAENTKSRDDLEAQHGLSLYIEANNRKLLLDTGQNDLFRRNGEALGVDFADIDTVVISHGHVDHGGGLAAFLAVNSRATVYLSDLAFADYLAEKDGQHHYIGLDQKLKEHPQIRLVSEERLSLGDGIDLFRNIRGREFFPEGNRSLLVKAGTEVKPDDFAHELFLVIVEGERKVVFGGCGHNGIANIVQEDSLRFCKPATHFVSGFHLTNPLTGEHESPELLAGLAARLGESKAVFLTGHCTGPVAYDLLKQSMGDQLQAISTGDDIRL